VRIPVPVADPDEVEDYKRYIELIKEKEEARQA